MKCLFREKKHLPLPLLPFLMLLPWGWITLGMWGVKSVTFTVCSYMVFGCLLPYLLFATQKPNISTQGLNTRWVLGGILFGMATMFVGWSLLGELLFIPEQFEETLNKLGFKEGRHFIYFALYFVFINPILEELFWRGLIYQRCSEVMPLKWAVLASSILFGSYHWLILQTSFTPIGAFLATLSVIIGGFIFTFFYQRTNSLLAPILVHGLGYDLPIIILAYLQLSNTGSFSLF